MSKLIDIPFDEEQITSIADKALAELTKKIKEDIADKFYEEMSGYLYQHYENNREKIENELLEKLVGRYVDESDHYRFRELRDKLFEEHKEEIVASLTDQAIQESVTNIIKKYTHKSHVFEWQWMDGIADFICENPDLFLEDERFGKRIAVRIKNRDEEIARLQQRVGQYEF